MLETIEEGDHAACGRSSATCCSRWSSTPGSPRSTRGGVRHRRRGRRDRRQAGPPPPARVRRVEVDGAEEVSDNWETIKAAERAAKNGGDSGSVVDGVPMGQPALSLAAQLLRRAERVGATAELPSELPAEGWGAALRARTAGARGRSRPGGRTARRRPRLPRPGPRPGVMTGSRTVRSRRTRLRTGPGPPAGRPRTG